MIKLRIYCGNRAVVHSSFTFSIPVSTQPHQVYFLYLLGAHIKTVHSSYVQMQSCGAWKADCSARCRHTRVFFCVRSTVNTTKTHFLPLMSADAH